ncbi:hypothetical protein AAXB25_14575 [Paenibacillus lautus]|uniref:hypothetical protein n=1 Tax=Paenibacillus lautus TaxID=1401 RepID=UPI003D2CEDE1
MPYSDYRYLDPLHIVWRKGTPEDPYVDKIEYLKVVNSKVILSEIPDKISRVKIGGLKEINYDGLPKKSIQSDEFSVIYETGQIEFHPSFEAKDINVMYKARGFIQYPSSRIYHQDKHNGVVESLRDIIDNAQKSIVDMENKINDYILIRNELLNAIIEAKKATTDTKRAIQIAEVATKDAIDATENAIDAYNSTIMLYQNPVANVSDIKILYPRPVNGMRVMVTSTGDIYRYDGIITKSWVLIDNYAGGSVPVVNDQINGLMRKEDFTKMHTKLDSKSIVFVIPKGDLGILKPIIRFPMSGEIQDVYAYCAEVGQTVDSTFNVEKVSEADFISNSTWATVADFNINAKAKKSTNLNISNNVVNEGDYFRVYASMLDDSLKGITIQVDIKI